MTTPHDWLARRGGYLGQIFTREELREAGMNWRDIAAALSRGDLKRLKRGIYASPDTHPALAAAASTGSRLACATALAAYGVWTRDDRCLHLQCKRRRAGQISHWAQLPFPDEVEEYGVGLRNALWQAVQCLPFVDAVAACDSALHSGRLSLSEWEELVVVLPEKYHRILEWVDPRAESGLESAMRCVLRRDGIDMLPQQWLGAGTRVDGLVGPIVVEADGREFHLDVARDYEREFRLARLGHATLRFTYEMLWERAEEVAQAVRAVLERCDPGWLARNCQGWRAYPW